MVVYLDPSLYIYEAEEWASYDFVERFEALISAIRIFKETESDIGELYNVFRFRTSEDLSSIVYERNPISNNPPIADFYRRQFQSRILPDLLRRMDACPTQDCVDETVSDVVQPPDAIRKENTAAQLFHELLQLCSMCSLSKQRCLVYYNGHRSLEDRGGYFKNEVVLPSVELAKEDATSSKNTLLKATDPTKMLMRALHGNSTKLLETAIRSSYELLREKDSEWSICDLGHVMASVEFWDDLRKADFKGRNIQYYARILYAATQIACNKDLTINAHRMIGVTILHENISHTPWNAYVFKMGADDQDKRCSRIYYIRTGLGAVLCKYDPNAHP